MKTAKAPNQILKCLLFGEAGIHIWEFKRIILKTIHLLLGILQTLRIFKHFLIVLFLFYHILSHLFYIAFGCFSKSVTYDTMSIVLFIKNQILPTVKYR